MQLGDKTHSTAKELFNLLEYEPETILNVLQQNHLPSFV